MSDRIKHFRMSDRDAKFAGLKDHQRTIEVRYDSDSSVADGDQRTIDEIVMAGVHLEMMAEDACWIDIGGFSIWLRAVPVKGRQKPRLVVSGYPNGCVPADREARP